MIEKLYLKLNGKFIPINFYEGFKKRGTITFDLTRFDNLKFYDVVEWFSTLDISTIEIYYTTKEGTDSAESDKKLKDKMVGYTKIVTYLENKETGMATITLDKPDATNMSLDELKAMAKEQATTEMNNSSINYVARIVATTFTDDQALNCIDLFVDYKVNQAYKVGDRFKYKGQLYKVIQAHTSQADWLPDITKSLYVNVADPAIEFPEFVQPTGAHDAYKKGDKVAYKGKHYISKIDANVYAPDAYPAGWEVVV